MIYDNLFSSLLVHINQRQDLHDSTHTYFIASACMELISGASAAS